MTELLERAVAAAAGLGPEDQDALAALMLEEMEAEHGWQRRFNEHPAVLDELLAELEQDRQAGRLMPLDPARL